MSGVTFLSPLLSLLLSLSSCLYLDLCPHQAVGALEFVHQGAAISVVFDAELNFEDVMELQRRSIQISRCFTNFVLVFRLHLFVRDRA